MAQLWRTVSARVDAAALCEMFLADLAHSDAGDEVEQLTAAQAATESGYTVARLKQLAKQGKLGASGTGRNWRVRRGDLPRKPSGMAYRARPLHLLGAKAEQVVRDSVGATNGTPR